MFKKPEEILDQQAIDHEDMLIREVPCNVGTIALRADKILTFTPFEGVTTCNLKDLKEQYHIFMELTKGVPHLLYMNSPDMSRLDSEERNFIGTNSHHFCSGMAIRENSAVTRFIVHSVMYLNKPQIPVKMFKHENDAINWLKSLN